MKPRHWLAAGPAFVLAAAFAAICIDFQTLWPFPLVVHEDGQHTLWGTIFYFEHALQELPLEILIALAIAGAMRGASGRIQASPAAMLAFVASLDGLILLGSFVTIGVRGSWMWLLQYHTRD